MQQSRLSWPATVRPSVMRQPRAAHVQGPPRRSAGSGPASGPPLQFVAQWVDQFQRHGLGIRPLRQQRHTLARGRMRSHRPQRLTRQCRDHLTQSFALTLSRLAALSTSSSIASVVRMGCFASHQTSNIMVAAKLAHRRNPSSSLRRQHPAHGGRHLGRVDHAGQLQLHQDHVDQGGH